MKNCKELLHPAVFLAVLSISDWVGVIRHTNSLVWRGDSLVWGLTGISVFKGFVVEDQSSHTLVDGHCGELTWVGIQMPASLLGS
jgi:hypothetical protein